MIVSVALELNTSPVVMVTIQFLMFTVFISAETARITNTKRDKILKSRTVMDRALMELIPFIMCKRSILIMDPGDIMRK